MNPFLFLLAAFGMAMIIISMVKPPQKEDTSLKSLHEMRCGHIDYLFQKQFHDGMIEDNKRTKALREQLRTLIGQANDINNEINLLYEELLTTRDKNITEPSNFESLNYMFGEKLMRSPIEDRHRGDTQVPSFETPSFLSEYVTSPVFEHRE